MAADVASGDECASTVHTKCWSLSVMDHRGYGIKSRQCEPGDSEGLVLYKDVCAVERVNYIQNKDPRSGSRVGVANTSGGKVVTCDVVAGGAALPKILYRISVESCRNQFTFYRTYFFLQDCARLKSNTPPEIFKHRFYELCHEFKNYYRIFTDGSKEGNRVAAAVVH